MRMWPRNKRVRTPVTLFRTVTLTKDMKVLLTPTRYWLNSVTVVLQVWV